jgi:hypothetical protein
MDMARNLTLKLDEPTIARAKLLAAKRGMSVSSMLRHEIERLVSDDAAYGSAMASATKRLASGHHLGGGKLPSRDEAHER